MVTVKARGCSGYVPLRRRLHIYRIIKGLSHTPHIGTSCLDALSRDNPLPVLVLLVVKDVGGGLGGSLKKREVLDALPQCTSVFVHVHYYICM